MIIKSKSYKHLGSFCSVLSYILRENEKEDGFILSKFVKGKNLSSEQLQKQLLINEALRINKRKNNVVLYMDILSFHPKDAKHLDNQKLYQIALKYLSLRAPKSIAIATVHRHEKKHIHLHICFSGVEYKTGKSIRISKEDFKKKVKLEMERYQQEMFPELERSKIRHEKSNSIIIKQKKEFEIILERKSQTSEKQQILLLLEEAFKTATNESDFYTKLIEKGCLLYTRGGKITGIESVRKFRFKTLGFTPEVLRTLEQNATLVKRMQLLETIEQNRNEKQNEHYK